MLLALRLVMMAFATLCEANAPPSASAIPSMNIPNPLEAMSRVEDFSPAPDGSRADMSTSCDEPARLAPGIGRIAESTGAVSDRVQFIGRTRCRTAQRAGTVQGHEAHPPHATEHGP
jgi:hypothetical protein